LDIDKIDFNHANTRNIALQYDADFYLFMTQDALPYDNTLIEKLLEPFENTDVVVSYARQIPYPDADFTEIFARTTNYPAVSKLQSYENLPQLGIKTFFNSDSCAMYRGDYFRKMGGFKPNTNTSEDMEFAARAVMNRKKIAYCADAKVYHSHNFTIKQLWSRYREIGKFFKDNQWILKTVSQFNSTESTGIKQAAKEVFYLLRHQPLLIPRSLMNSVIKYIAFKLNS
jgi:rhamnosyltransferase